jgi:transcriptional regulator with XRE-family HTH domain
MMIGNRARRVTVPDQAAADDSSGAPLRTLADKVNWLIDRAHPAGRGPYTNAEIAAQIEKITGEQYSHTTIWKLRNGQATNPQMRLIEALARTFGVPPAFFFPDYDEEQAGLLQEQVELLALVRDTGVTTAQLRALLELSPGARQAVADLIEHTARVEAPRRTRSS